MEEEWCNEQLRDFIKSYNEAGKEGLEITMMSDAIDLIRAIHNQDFDTAFRYAGGLKAALEYYRDVLI